jgi:hypothetical protein
MSPTDVGIIAGYGADAAAAAAAATAVCAASTPISEPRDMRLSKGAEVVLLSQRLCFVGPKLFAKTGPPRSRWRLRSMSLLSKSASLMSEQRSERAAETLPRLPTAEILCTCPSGPPLPVPLPLELVPRPLLLC